MTQKQKDKALHEFTSLCAHKADALCKVLDITYFQCVVRNKKTKALTSFEFDAKKKKK